MGRTTLIQVYGADFGKLVWKIRLWVPTLLKVEENTEAKIWERMQVESYFFEFVKLSRHLWLLIGDMNFISAL